MEVGFVFSKSMRNCDVPRDSPKIRDLVFEFTAREIVRNYDVRLDNNPGGPRLPTVLFYKARIDDNDVTDIEYFFPCLIMTYD
jgi:hypothetical protein